MNLRYGAYGSGFVDVIGAGLQALPGILQILNPQPPPVPVRPPSYTPIILGIGGLLAVGGLAILVMRK